MSYKDICQAWVDERKYEDDDGMFYVDDGEVSVEGMEGPYTEEEIDDILWRRATDGEAIESCMVY